MEVDVLCEDVSKDLLAKRSHVGYFLKFDRLQIPKLDISDVVRNEEIVQALEQVFQHLIFHMLLETFQCQIRL